MDQIKCDIYNNEEKELKILREKLELKENYSTVICDKEVHYRLYIGHTNNNNLRIMRSDMETEICPEHIEILKIEEAKMKKMHILRQNREIKTFTNYNIDFNNQGKEVNLIKSFPYNEKYRKLILVGKTGIGKTHLSLALKHFIKLEGFESELIHVQKLYKIFRDMNFFEAEREALDNLKDLKSNHLLIVDDLGLEKQTEKGVFNYGFIELIDTFKGKLVITSNFNIDEMKEIYDDKIISRLLEKSLIIYLTGLDYRKKQ